MQTWKREQNRLNQFWILWRNEYLLSLREKSQVPLKGSKNIPTPPKIGDVVLVKENLPHGHWRVGRIVEVIKGKDQKIRSAKVNVAPNKYLNRAVSMLYLSNVQMKQLLTLMYLTWRTRILTLN